MPSYPTNRILKAQKLCPALKLDAGLSQAINQQRLMLVLRKDQGSHLEATLDDRASEAKLIVHSSVRAWTTSARDVVHGSAVWSTIRTRTPNRLSHKANTKPVGPAPTIRTVNVANH